MKKRMIILPLSAFTLISCSSNEPESDIRNRYASKDKCVIDNPLNEIRTHLDTTATQDQICEQITADNKSYWLGPAYPHSNYGLTGFIAGYWMGKSLTNSRGVTYKDGSSHSHKDINTKGGISSIIPTNEKNKENTKSRYYARGGFGNYGSVLAAARSGS